MIQSVQPHREVMREEYQSLLEMNTWSLTERTTAVEERQEIIQSRWVFSRKELSDGKIRYKAWVVVKGFQQMPGVDFQDTFAPVERLDTCRVLVALAAYYNWEIQQLDVVTAFWMGNYQQRKEFTWSSRTGSRIIGIQLKLHIQNPKTIPESVFWILLFMA